MLHLQLHTCIPEHEKVVGGPCSQIPSPSPQICQQPAEFTADMLVLDSSLCQASALQLAGLTLDGMIHLCSHNEHLFAVLLPDLVALWLLGQTRGLGTC